jgi:hypothetical protein
MKRGRPDNHLDWRDPDMPCVRVTKDRTGKLAVELIPPKEVRAEARKDFKNADLPRYRGDPSYWWSTEASFRKLEDRAGKLGECYETCTTPRICLYAGCKNGKES